MAKKKKERTPAEKFMRIMVMVMLLATLAVIILCWNVPNFQPGSKLGAFGAYEPSTAPTEETEPIFTEPPMETEPMVTRPVEPERVVTTATIGAVGDVSMDLPILNACQRSDGSFDFDGIFQYLSPYVSRVDYAAANLETTLAGLDTGYRYSGYGSLNCPDALVKSLKTAGFDLLLTANEHSYDTAQAGLLRTLEVIRRNGLEPLGTVADPREPISTMVNLNGIQVAFLNFTMTSEAPEGAQELGMYLNGHHVPAEDEGRIATFETGRPDILFIDLQSQMTQLRSQGAEAFVVFLHWGKQYTTKTVDYQTAIAQRLCDLGVDVIIGSHPHVLQPVELLTSAADSGHKTLCLYSLGNTLTNQRTGGVAKISTGHIEDGGFASITLEKYSDGKVYVRSVDVLPLWLDVRLKIDREYTILPLDANIQDVWSSAYSLGDYELKGAQASFKRTANVLSKSLPQAQQALDAAKQQREAAYFSAWLR